MLALPPFEFSYETVSHKNVPDTYNLAMAIPNGKKYCAWFSFDHDGDHLYLLDLNKERKIVKTTVIGAQFDNSLAYGTMLYGAMIPDTNAFIIEDIFIYKGASMKQQTVGERFYYLHDFLENHMPMSSEIVFALPVLWCDVEIPESEIPYQVHHIQYRSLTAIVPYLNVQIIRKPVIDKMVTPISVRKSAARADFSKIQYKYATVFQVTADLQYDIYNLFAYNNVFFNTACIPDYKTSVFMNGLFRKIRENMNIDYIEESDDESDFENTDENRYVDLKKSLFMECIFSAKFKRWIPKRVVGPPTKVVNIHQLCGK